MPNELPYSARNSAHPERYILGKPHPDRARQFKPFAALRGYEELIEHVMAEANEPHGARRILLKATNCPVVCHQSCLRERMR